MTKPLEMFSGLLNIIFWGHQFSTLEILAMLTGILAVWLTAKQNILCFPVGMVNVILYAVLFFDPGVRLYADGLLQCIYIILLIYGWINWNRKSGKENSEEVKMISGNNAVRLSVLTFLASIILGYIFKRYTDATYPWLDSCLTSISLAAQWMIARKFIENWYLWIFADLIYIPLYILKSLPLTAFLYFFFLLLALKGVHEWKSTLKKLNA